MPTGGITEVIGHGKTELAVRFLTEHPDFKVAWIEKSFSLNPAALQPWNIQLENILFIESGLETLWVTLQVLRSTAFHAVILYQDSFSVADLRKIQLASEKSGSVLFWLSGKSPLNPWPITLRLQTYRDSENSDVSVNVLQRRSL